MSGTKRKPIKRPQRPRITPTAIKTFRAMGKLPCTCGPPVWKPDRPGQITVVGGVAGGLWVPPPPCDGCQERHRLAGILHAELGLRPWQNVIESPDEQGASADEIALYRELEAAARGEPSPWDRRAKVISDLEGNPT